MASLKHNGARTTRPIVETVHESRPHKPQSTDPLREGTQILAYDPQHDPQQHFAIDDEGVGDHVYPQRFGVELDSEGGDRESEAGDEGGMMRISMDMDNI
jgi:hypothetical protein